MKIVYLPKNKTIIKTLATWVYDEWVKPNNSAVSLKSIIDIFRVRTNSQQIPLTLVALSEEGEAMGCGSLTISDMKTRTDLSPWMAGIYVSKKFRNQGVAHAICKQIESEAKRLKIDKIYLFTKDQEQMYKKFGWKTISREEYKEMMVTVMSLDVKL